MFCAVVAAKSLQSCLTLCDPMDSSLPGSPVPGILQWVAISFSSASKWKVKMKSLSHVRPLVTPWTAAYQAPPSMGVSGQEYRSRVPLPSPSLLSSSQIFDLIMLTIWKDKVRVMVSWLAYCCQILEPSICLYSQDGHFKVYRIK